MAAAPLITAPPAGAAPDAEAEFSSRPMTVADVRLVEQLHDAAFGPGALTRAAYRVREGQPPYTPFCRVLMRGSTLVAAIRYTQIRIGGTRGALLLGPLMVAPAFANQGHGRRLIAESLEAAQAAGIVLVLLVGDPPYYARFGFVPARRGQFEMPGPVDPARLLVRTLQSPAGTADEILWHGRVRGMA